jgi:two-component system sensor histidine kinase UhpB
VSVRARPPAHVEIAVSDDGAGRGGPFSEGVGMALMRQRAEEIGAEIAYAAGPERGTTVVVHLPRVPRAADPQGRVSP